MNLFVFRFEGDPGPVPRMRGDEPNRTEPNMSEDEKIEKAPQEKEKATNAFGAIRDIGMAAIQSGQVISVGFVGVALSIIWRLPPESLAQIVNRVLDMFGDYALWGWIGALISSLLWIYGRRQSNINAIKVNVLTEKSRKIKTELERKKLND